MEAAEGVDADGVTEGEEGGAAALVDDDDVREEEATITSHHPFERSFEYP